MLHIECKTVYQFVCFGSSPEYALTFNLICIIAYLLLKSVV